MDKQFLAAKHGYDCSMTGDTITAWRDARPQPDWDELWITALEEKRIGAIKEKASDLITARYPAWKQNNLTAQAVESILNYLLMLPGTDEAKAQLTNSILGLGAWEWVKQVRSESDRLESNPEAIESWPE